MTGTVPLRLKPRDAAAMLSIEVAYLYQLVADGVFEAIRPHGKGPGKPFYLDPAEVRAYATGGPDAVRALRATTNPTD